MVEEMVQAEFSEMVDQIVEKADFLLKLNVPRAFVQISDNTNVMSLAKSFASTLSKTVNKQDSIASYYEDIDPLLLSRNVRVDKSWKISMNEWRE